MPLYEYQCEACEHRFERIQKFSDPLVDTCPECAGKVRKLLSSPAFQFKGSGWYITDYARQDKDKDKKGGDGNKADSSDKSDTSDKKTESTSTSDTSSSSGSSSGSSSSTEKKASTPAPAHPTKSE
jgi:putative FmdB family regulatory protein